MSASDYPVALPAAAAWLIGRAVWARAWRAQDHHPTAAPVADQGSGRVETRGGKDHG